MIIIIIIIITIIIIKLLYTYHLATNPAENEVGSSRHRSFVYGDFKRRIDVSVRVLKKKKKTQFEVIN